MTGKNYLHLTVNLHKHETASDIMGERKQKEWRALIAFTICGFQELQRMCNSNARPNIVRDSGVSFFYQMPGPLRKGHGRAGVMNGGEK